MHLPYFKQETSYTCGAAALRMVLASIGINKTEKQVAKILGTNRVKGTLHDDFFKVAEHLKLKYIVERKSSVKDLKKLQDENYRIIVNYLLPVTKVGHYAVVREVGSKYIHLLDPFIGPDQIYPISNFIKNWKSGFEKDYSRWFFAIKK